MTDASTRAAAALASAGHEEAARAVHDDPPADGPDLADLDLDAALVAAAPLADAVGLDPDPVATAVEYARADLDSGDEGSRFVTFVWDFVTDAGGRALIHQRLGEHVERREMRESDVDGLF